MNDQFLQGVLFDWNRIDNDSYLKRIKAFKGIEKHAEWVKKFLPKYPEITKENIHGILQKEIGIVFTHVLEDAGVYKCTSEGREAFMRFLETL